MTRVVDAYVVARQRRYFERGNAVTAPLLRSSITARLPMTWSDAVPTAAAAGSTPRPPGTVTHDGTFTDNRERGVENI